MNYSSKTLISIVYLLFLVVTKPVLGQNNSSDNNIPDPTPQTDPVLVNGNWYHSEKDLDYLVLGDEFSFTRTYNSMSKFDRSLSLGWSHNFDMHLLRKDNGDLYFINRDGRKVLLKKQRNNSEYYPIKAYYPRLKLNTDNTFKLLFREGRKYHFNVKGKLTSIEDISGNRTTLEYDENGYLVKIKDPVLKGFDLTNNSNGQIIQIKDHTGRETKYNYDNDNRLAEVIQVDGLSIKYNYDKKGRLTTLTNQNNDKYQFVFDNKNRMTKNIDPLGNEENFSYPNILGIFPQRKQIFQNKKGHKVTYKYNETAKITDVHYPNDIIRKRKLDKHNNTIEITYADNTIEKMAYDKRGNMITFSDQNGNTTHYKYDTLFNKVTEEITPKGESYTFTYDRKGNLVKQTKPNKVSEFFQYNEYGLLSKGIGANKDTISYEYDNLGNIASINYPIGTERYNRDELGNIEVYIDPNGRQFISKYDAKNQIEYRVSPSLDTAFFTYNHHGKLQYLDLPNKVKLSLKYDKMGNLTEGFLQDSLVVSYKYDELNNVIEIGTPDKRKVSFTYSSNNQPLSKTNFLGDVTFYHYNKNLEITKIIDPNKDTIYYNYDRVGNLISKRYKDGFDQYKYDENNNLVSAINKNMTLSYEYDNSGRVLVERWENWDKELRYQWYDFDKKKSVLGPENVWQEYKFDNNNRLIEIKNNWETVNLDLNLKGDVIKRYNTNGTYSMYSWNDNSQPNEISHYNKVNGLLSKITNKYDDLGNKILLTKNDTSKTVYGYDLINQLTEINSEELKINTKFRYDSWSNRLSKNQEGIETTYNYDKADRLIRRENTDYIYDKNGNLILSIVKQDTTQYYYDGENRLTKIILSDLDTMGFSYDPFGRRIERKLPDGNIYRYFYDDQNMWLEYDSDFELKTCYSSIETDEWLGYYDFTSNNYFTLHNEIIESTRGNISLITDSSGDVIHEFNYDPFGTALDNSKDISFPLAFNGRFYEEEVNLYYYRQRFYDPSLGRFIQEDPIGHVYPLNLYAYTFNNPLAFTDPLGANPVGFGTDPQECSIYCGPPTKKKKLTFLERMRIRRENRRERIERHKKKSLEIMERDTREGKFGPPRDHARSSFTRGAFKWLGGNLFGGNKPGNLNIKRPGGSTGATPGGIRG